MMRRVLGLAVLLCLCPLVAEAQFIYRRPIPINPGDDWQTKIDAATAGQPFVIKAGTHRFQSVNPKSGQAFVGESGAIMSGARVLASGSFVTAGSFWKITGQTQTLQSRHGECQTTIADGGTGFDWATSYPGCDFAEELFYDNVRKVRVETLGEMGAGEWFFNDATDEIYVGDNPSGHTVETSITAFAFNPTGDNVRIQNLTIEKYATQAQYGPVNGEGVIGWVVSGNTIRYNHGAGIRLGTGMRVSRNLVTRNGQIGVTGIGDDVIVEDNEISYNNDAHFDPGWEAGGTKFVQTDRLNARRNFVHHNDGPGLWADIDNIRYLFENNLSEDNSHVGIFIEISYTGIVRNNIVNRNGLAYWVPDYIWGVGILNAASPNLEVYGNTLVGNRGGIAGVQQSRGSGSFGDHLIQNYSVHDNTITVDKTGITPAYAAALVDSTSSTTLWTTDNNHFEGNVFTLKTDLNSYFEWNNGERTWAAWQGFGNDTPIGSATTF